MVTARLSLQDAKEKGWLLDGYPRSSAQAESLEKLNVRPDIYVVLDVRKTMTLPLLMIMPDNDIAQLPMKLLGIYSIQNLLENTPIFAHETNFHTWLSKFMYVLVLKETAKSFSDNSKIVCCI